MKAGILRGVVPSQRVSVRERLRSRSQLPLAGRAGKAGCMTGGAAAGAPAGGEPVPAPGTGLGAGGRDGSLPPAANR